MELECLDRLYRNAYVPKLTNENGVAWFFRGHRGHRFASPKAASPMTERFVAAIGQFQRDHDLELVRFQKGQRKDEVFQSRLKKFKGTEGVVFIGVAQEKARGPRTIRKQFQNGATIPWIVYSTALVNCYYCYCLDADFGPFFRKFCSYFPYTAKLCRNGHEYLKCQLRQRGIAFEALDNGRLACAEVPAAQRIADGLSAQKIEAFFRKWLRHLPHPFGRKDRAAGYRYELSVLQAEFSLTQVWDRGTSGRCFFEEVIRENLDLGRPEQVQLIFQRKMQRKTATDGRNRTRIITEGGTPSLHVYYKNTHLKQSHKAGRALRTETTINNTYDFGVGRRLKNLPALRQIGCAANRRVPEVEQVSHDCQIGSAAFEKLQPPATVQGQHASALRFGDARVQALLSVLVCFCLQPEGFRNQPRRPLLAQYLGRAKEQLTPGRMSYELRRLRLHGVIERVAGTQRYRLTGTGLRTALFYARVYQRVLRPGLSLLHDQRLGKRSALTKSFHAFHTQLTQYFQHQLAA